MSIGRVKVSHGSWVPCLTEYTLTNPLSLARGLPQRFSPLSAKDVPTNPQTEGSATAARPFHLLH